MPFAIIARFIGARIAQKIGFGSVSAPLTWIAKAAEAEERAARIRAMKRAELRALELMLRGTADFLGSIKVEIDDREVRAALARARRAINDAKRDALREAAQIGVANAKHLAPGNRIRAALSAGATTRGSYIQLNTRQAPMGPLLEFGGTVRTVLEPKHAQALSTPRGPRARVKNPRHYKGEHYMERAVENTRDDVERVAQEKMVRAFEQAGLDVT